MTDHRDEHETYGHTHSPVIEDLRKQVATLLDEQTGFRVAISTLTAERDEARKEAESWQDDALRMMRDRNTAERERDEARREICSTVVFPSSPKQYAERRGWDCFKEHGK
jgi:hypothetical protein